jgi:hypothetical protein
MYGFLDELKKTGAKRRSFKDLTPEEEEELIAAIKTPGFLQGRPVKITRFTNKK